MCTDQVLEHPQEKQGASVAVHATTGEAQATWSTLQQQLQGLAAAVEKLQARDDTVAVLLATSVARNDLTATALAVASPLAAHTVSDDNSAVHTTVVDTDLLGTMCTRNEIDGAVDPASGGH